MPAPARRRPRPSRVRPYRGGYLAPSGARSRPSCSTASSRGVVATTALELGIDIGGLDACVLNGFPGTIASMWQQAGPGRARRRSVRWPCSSPATTSSTSGSWPTPRGVHPAARAGGRQPRRTRSCCSPTSPAPPTRRRSHSTTSGGGATTSTKACASWCSATACVLRDRRGGTGAGAAPRLPGIGLRTGSSDEFRIAEADGTLVGTVDGARAFEAVHPGAIYLHQGQTLPCRALDLDDRAAIVEPVDGDEYTQVRTETNVAILSTEAHARRSAACSCTSAPCEVTSQVVGYDRRDACTRRRRSASNRSTCRRPAL